MYFSLRLWQYTEGVRLRIALAVFFGLAAAASGIARLALLGWLVGRVFDGRSIDSLIAPIIGIAGVTVLRVVLQFAKETVAVRTAAAVQRTLRRRLYDKALELGPAHFDQKRTGDVSATLVEGVEQLETYFGQYLPQFFTAALAPAGIFIFMAFLDLPTAGIYLGFALFALIIPSIFHRLNAASSERRRTAYGAFAADFLDSIQGLATLKAFGQSKARGDALAHRAHEVFRSTMMVLASNSATQAVTVGGIAIGAAVALAVGATRVNSGAMDFQVLLIILMLGLEVFRPLRELSLLFHQGLLGISAAQGVFNMMEAQPAVADVERERHALAGSRPSIQFDGVTFSYPSGRRPALQDVSFHMEPGDRVGIVGRSGSGKTTLMWLVQRMYEPQQGRILLCGHDLRELSFDQIRSQMAVVTQDTYLFHGTVADNLRFGRPSATPAELQEAARAANAHEFISRLPQGYDTAVGERALKLSGGERQRIAIARALLRDAPILVLDEALSSVDAENEATIQEALSRLMAGRTTLIMAHRLSSVIDCKQILVLEEGRLVESGAHAQLLAGGGAYAQLMADQAFDSEWIETPPPTSAADVVAADAQVAVRDEAAELEPTDGILRAEGMGWAETVRELLSLVAPQRLKLAGSFLFGVSYFLGFLSIGVISALMVANVRNGDPIGALVAVLILIAVLSALFRWLESWISHDVAFRLLSEMRITLFRKLDGLAPGYLLRRRTGDLVAMATQDVETVEYFFAHTIANSFVAIVVPAGALITLLVFGWPLALGLLPFLVVAATSPLLTRVSIDTLGSDARTNLAALNAHAVDTLQGMREIVVFQRSSARKGEFDELAREYLPLRVAFNGQIAAQRALLELLMGLGGLTVLSIGAAMAASGDLAPTTVPLLTLLAMGSFLPITELAQIGRRLGDTLGATRRLAAVHAETVTVTDGPGVVGSAEKPARAAFDGVEFRYEHASGPALRGVTFQMRPGATIALVGPSGAGKTTAAHLLLRFWDPSTGRIALDGSDLREYRLDEMRGRIALVAQDTYIFNASIRENLLVARPDATEKELGDAMEQGGLTEFVASLPERLDTPVGERGMQLSGGQRQRIAIGRALLKDSPVLVLDEATSHLDALNERLVRDGLSELMSDRTTLVIAHRLSTVRDADLIVVLSQGDVVEAGTHDELIGRGGLYARLAGAQMAGTAAAGASGD